MYAEDEEPQDELGGVYEDEGREDLIKDDEISPEEEAFMAGYETEEEKKEETADIYDEAFDKANAAALPKRKAAKKPASKKLAGSKARKLLKPAKAAPKKTASNKLAGSKARKLLKVVKKPAKKAKPTKKKAKAKPKPAKKKLVKKKTAKKAKAKPAKKKGKKR